MALNDRARVAISSWPRTTIRSSSKPSASRSATRAALRTGSTAWRVTSQVRNPSSATTPIAPPPSVRWTKDNEACSGLRS